MVGFDKIFGHHGSPKSGSGHSNSPVKKESADSATLAVGAHHRQEAVRELFGQLLVEFDQVLAENNRLIQELKEKEANPGKPRTSSAISKAEVTIQPPRPGGDSHISFENSLKNGEADPAEVITTSCPAEPVPRTDDNGDEVAIGMDPNPRESQVRRERSDQAFAPTGTRRSSTMSHAKSDSRMMEEALEVEDFYENLYDLTRAFHSLCAVHKSTIGAGDLIHMAANQQGGNPLDLSFEELQPRLESAIRFLNQELGVSYKTSQPGQGPEPLKEMNLDTFIAIMQRKEEKMGAMQSAGEDILDAIVTLRDILVKEDALRKVAKATNMAYGEIYEISKPTLRPTRLDKVISYLDPVIGAVIILNAIIIGVSTDYAKDSDIWIGFEVFFTFIFIVELVLKIIGFGPWIFFMGPEWSWNWFDAAVVSVALVDFCILFLGNVIQLRNFTIIRLLRFARLTKLIRVLKVKMFKELALLVSGIVAGFRTLIWAIIFLAFILFGLGVLLTQTIGQQEEGYWDEVCFRDDFGKGPDELYRACLKSSKHFKDHHAELFGNVPRSMFTVFRCFTDGCGAADGTPLVPYIYNTHGSLPVIVYMLVTLFVMFGLFNLIMAVFVENTIENAKHDEARRNQARNNEHVRAAKRLQEAIVVLCSGKEQDETPEEPESVEGDDDGDLEKMQQRSRKWFQKFFGTRETPEEKKEREALAGGNAASNLLKLSEGAARNLNIQVTHAAFMKMMQKEEVQEMLDDLDIGVTNRSALFEVLDANCNGTLEVGELVQGLLKLRGTSDKGETVASLLAIRSMQKTLKAMELLGLHQQEAIESIHQSQVKMQASIEEFEALNPWRSIKPSSDSAAGRSAALPGLNTVRADQERKNVRINLHNERVSRGGH